MRGAPRSEGQRGHRVRVLRWGWVPAAARTTGGGLGDRLGRRFGVRKKGWVPAFARTTGGSRLSSWRGEAYRRGDGDGSPQPRGQRVGDWGRGTGGSRTAPTEGEYCRALGSPPSSVFTRAGSNFPSSRGKGFVGDERAIFIVMTCGGCAALRSGGQPGRRRCLGGAIVA